MMYVALSNPPCAKGLNFIFYRQLAISPVQENILSDGVEVAETLKYLCTNSTSIDCIVNCSFSTTVVEKIHGKAYDLINKP